MRGASRMELTRLIGHDGENARDMAELSGLGWGEADGEAINGSVVGVEDLLGGGVWGGREGLDDRFVPVVVGGEEGGLV